MKLAPVKRRWPNIISKGLTGRVRRCLNVTIGWVALPVRCHLGREPDKRSQCAYQVSVSDRQCGRMSSTSILLLLILTLSSTTTAVTIEPNEAAVKGDPFLVSTLFAVLIAPPCYVVFLSGDISPATSTNPWTRLAHLFQDVQKLNGHERGAFMCQLCLSATLVCT